MTLNSILDVLFSVLMFYVFQSNAGIDTTFGCAIKLFTFVCVINLKLMYLSKDSCLFYANKFLS